MGERVLAAEGDLQLGIAAFSGAQLLEAQSLPSISGETATDIRASSCAVSPVLLGPQFVAGASF